MFYPTRKLNTTCGATCRKRQQRYNTYNSGNIKIMHPDFDEKYDWQLCPTLAEKYVKDVKFIERGVKACRMAGICPSYFIDKYLLKKDLPINQDVQAASRELQRRVYT